MTEETASQYHSRGYAHLPGFMPSEVCIGLLVRMKADLARQGIQLPSLEQQGPLLRSGAVELYGHHYPMFNAFLWGMTPAVERVIGEDLLPTYAYLRLYRQGDICRVHGDRQACEHSLSLTLAYSDDIPWPLELSTRRTEQLYARADEQFAVEEAAGSVAMRAGDAVLYQGVHHHHGRTSPNPNQWSAHLFLHWVARDGPYAAHAFDGQPPPAQISF
ncbi:MAG: hypothetical protein M3Q19_08665 [Pseudomonadota bacterium]|nr:hypothetical protein [Pseudomonadota bacterium]